MSAGHPGRREQRRRLLREGFEAREVTDAIVVFARLVRHMDATLARHEWLAGQSWSLADGALTPYVRRLELLGLASMWEGQPDFARWFAAAKARPSFGPAVENHVPAELRDEMRADGERARGELARILRELGI